MKRHLTKEQLRAIHAKGHKPSGEKFVTLRIPAANVDRYKRLRREIPEKKTQKEIDKDWEELISFEKYWKESIDVFGVGKYSDRMKWIADKLGVTPKEAEHIYQKILGEKGKSEFKHGDIVATPAGKAKIIGIAEGYEYTPKELK